MMVEESWPADLSAAFVAAQGELGKVIRAHTADVGPFSYRYADLAAVIEVVRPVLAAHGLAFTQDVKVITGDTVWITTIIVHTSGQAISFGPLCFPVTASPQAVGSVITYGRRYCLLAAFGLAAEDDDGAAAEAAAATPPRRAAAKKKMPPRPVTHREALTRRLKIATDAAGLNDPDVLRALASRIVGRDLSSSNELDDDEYGEFVASIEKTALEQAQQEASS